MNAERRATENAVRCPLPRLSARSIIPRVSGGASMKIHRERAGDALLLVPGERIDSTSAPEFERIARETVRDEPAALVVDLAGVDYISSAGLRVVLMAAKESRARGVRFALCGLHPEVLKLFETTGLSRILTIVPDRAAALASG